SPVRQPQAEPWVRDSRRCGTVEAVHERTTRSGRAFRPPARTPDGGDTPMTTMNTNGTMRKTLASQIDRLDGLLDGLADSLNAAVAAAVKETVAVAVEDAVRAAVREVLTNDELRRRLTSPPPQSPKPAPVPLAEKARRCWSWLVGAVQSGWQGVKAAAQAVAA